MDSHAERALHGGGSPGKAESQVIESMAMAGKTAYGARSLELEPTCGWSGIVP